MYLKIFLKLIPGMAVNKHTVISQATKWVSLISCLQLELKINTIFYQKQGFQQYHNHMLKTDSGTIMGKTWVACTTVH